MIQYDKKNGFALSIPFADISKIEYMQGKQPTEGINALQSRLNPKPDIIINANFYGMSNGVPCSYVVDEGVLISGGMSPIGYAFVDKKKPVYCTANSVKAVDFVGGYPSLLKDGQIFIDNDDKPFNNASRARTAIGLTAKNEFVIRVLPDSNVDYTIPQLAENMQSYGCINAINLDGGGSSQIKSPIGNLVTGRAVDGFILIYLEPNTDFVLFGSKPGDPKSYKVTTSSLRVRTGPGVSYTDTNKRYISGQIIQVIKTENGWANTADGWCSMEYLTLV